MCPGASIAALQPRVLGPSLAQWEGDIHLRDNTDQKSGIICPMTSEKTELINLHGKCST